MYAYVYVYVCICMYMYVNVCICMYMYVHVCMCMLIFTFTEGICVFSLVVSFYQYDVGAVSPELSHSIIGMPGLITCYLHRFAVVTHAV